MRLGNKTEGKYNSLLMLIGDRMKSQSEGPLFKREKTLFLVSCWYNYLSVLDPASHPRPEISNSDLKHNYVLGQGILVESLLIWEEYI